MTPLETRLLAGTASTTITPEWPVHMDCQPGREPLTATLDPVEAQATVLSDGTGQVAIITVDLTGIEPEQTEAIQAQIAAMTAIPAAHVLVIASHTHSAPATTRFKGVPLDPAYLRWLETRLAHLVALAASAMEPATLGAGEGSMDFNVNRRRRTPAGMVLGPSPGGLVDRRVRVLRVDRADGSAPPTEHRAPGTLGDTPLPQQNPLAVLFSYGCHPTVKSSQSYRFSGDYPGVARRFIEQTYAPYGALHPQSALGTLRTLGTSGLLAGHDGASPVPGCLPVSAHFLPPCFGDLRPHLLRPEGGWREGTDYELAALGRLLGSEVVQVAERIITEPVERIAFGRRTVWLPYRHVATEAELQAALGTRQGWWAEALLARLTQEGRLPDGESVEVQVLRIGRHWIVCTPGETMQEIGLSIERGLANLGLAHPERGDMVLPLGYTNNYVGYLCTATAALEGGYEPGAWPDYQRPGPFALEIEPLLVNAALAVAQELGPFAG